MAQNFDVLHRRKLGIHIRLIEMDVQAGRLQLPRLQSLNECILINQLPASDIDQPGTLLHFSYLPGIQHFTPSERRDYNNTIGDREHILDILEELGINLSFNRLRQSSNIIIHNLHRKTSPRFLRNPLPDPSQANDAQRMPAGIDRAPGEAMLRFLKPLRVQRPRSQGRLGQKPKSADDEVDSHIGDGFGASGCGVAVDDAALGEPLDVDPVETRGC